MRCDCADGDGEDGEDGRRIGGDGICTVVVRSWAVWMGASVHMLTPQTEAQL